MGKLTEAVNRLLSSLQITSASPGHINEVLQSDPSIDLDEALGDALQDTGIKEQKDITESVKKVKKFDDGQVGEIQRMTSQQFSNVMEFAKKILLTSLKMNNAQVFPLLESPPKRERGVVPVGD